MSARCDPRLLTMVNRRDPTIGESREDNLASLEEFAVGQHWDPTGRTASTGFSPRRAPTRSTRPFVQNGAGHPRELTVHALDAPEQQQWEWND